VNTDNLFLIGYRCTGKSSVGKLLAAALSRMFVDTDSLVASQKGMSIREIDLNR
jgi:shikimate kinase